MGSAEARFASAYAVASGLLMMESRITQEALERVVTAVGAMPTFADIDLKRLTKELEADNNVHVGGYSVIDDKEFRAWIGAKRETLHFAFWERYRHFLEKRKRIPRDVLIQLDRLTDDILDRLRDPDTPGDWDRRGLVVGDVQSGKTSNYIGLICKAVDSGFPLIIVLAGVHNSLRSQTQLRLDEGFLGFDTRLNLVFEQENQRIGAGAMPGAPFLVAHSLTSSTETGDFRRGTAQGTKIVPGGRDPVILVVKKRVSILTNLIAWVLSVRGESDPAVPGGRAIRDISLLVIDDEADNASANTNEYRDEDGNINEDNDPTRTNRLIRQLLTAFQKSAYVGYTATPFANVFMHHEAFAKDVGKDLFPSSFIINIPAPSNYIGAEKVFGLKRPGSADDEAGLPIIRPVFDADAIFPPRHKKALRVSELPDTLHEAVLAFILTCAARRVRGDAEVDNSMLVHVTRFTLVQEQVARLLDEELIDIRRQLEFPGAGGYVEKRLHDLWERDFAANASALREALPDHDLPEVSWDEVKRYLFDATKRIVVRKINGSAKDALDYREHPRGLSVIAVGGDKLSRGLTLEGLSVSYFVRTSRMYDTLMQMGRWFGYRPRYADLCRLYTSPELLKWYRHIATATAELREEFDLMFAIGGNPLQFGNRVRTHPDGLLITAANKMRAGTRIRAGFSGTISETVSFDLASAERNFGTFAAFLERLPRIKGASGRYAWKDVEGSEIATLMRALETSRDSWKANSQAISEYITDRVKNGRLTRWTVSLVAAGRSKKSLSIGPYPVTLIQRDNRSEGDRWKYTIGRLVSPSDEATDLDESKYLAALAATTAAWEKKTAPKGDRPEIPGGPFIRKQRDFENGLLLIYPIDWGTGKEVPLMGFAVSFPFDDDAPLIEYAENSVKQLEELFE
ncbi:Z1 domain-containing protein [Nitrosovibrio sp. Nv6]|uniref:Z1 domain-containing protein n=1 Tax=Nitrosovibrio sp. Nv6 TaxID=1855340 RepID=UPI0008C35BA8|nr:Z1 domain-containing protein [Nitrosovibrio sp. Nv6]SEP19409.1 Z1 domain-containing protein [Nitrosovibrio sp. Nv6]